MYYVSLTGVTGARQSLPSDIKANIRRIKSITTKPVCVGFGISTPAQVKELGEVADGIIVASAIIKEIERNAGQKDLVAKISNYVANLARSLE
jgi:tryptophan synthase alpha chain